MPANANCGLWRPIARLPAASVPAGGPTSTPLSDPSSAQQSDAVSMLMPLYDKRYRDKLRSHRVEQLREMFEVRCTRFHASSPTPSAPELHAPAHSLPFSRLQESPHTWRFLSAETRAPV